MYIIIRCVDLTFSCSVVAWWMSHDTIVPNANHNFGPIIRPFIIIEIKIIDNHEWYNKTSLIRTPCTSL